MGSISCLHVYLTRARAPKRGIWKDRTISMTRKGPKTSQVIWGIWASQKPGFQKAWYTSTVRNLWSSICNPEASTTSGLRPAEETRLRLLERRFRRDHPGAEERIAEGPIWSYRNHETASCVRPWATWHALTWSRLFAKGWDHGTGWKWTAKNKTCRKLLATMASLGNGGWPVWPFNRRWID